MIKQFNYNTIRLAITPLITILINVSLFSQDLVLRFNHFTLTEGTPQHRINGIVKDKYGFMWFSSWNGITKYDGYKFQNYMAEKDNPKSIPTNRIQQLYKDHQENIWFSTFDSSIFRYNYDSDDFTKFKKQNVKKYILDSLNRDRSIFYTKINTPYYIWQVNQVNNILTLNLPNEKIDNLLVQTNPKTGTAYIYKLNPLNPWSINDEFVLSIYKDDNDLLWVGTYGGGVNKADLRQKRFLLYQHSPVDNNTIIDNAVRAVCEDNNGSLWVGTNNKGLTKFDQKRTKCTHYQSNPKNVKNSLISNKIRMLFCDRYGYIWIGTKDGLDRFDLKSNRFHHYAKNSPNSIPENNVFWISEDREGYLWIGTWNGIAKYDRIHDKFLAFKTKYSPKQERIRVILNDKNNTFWIATDGGGLVHIKRETKGIQEKFSLIDQYVNSPNNLNSLSDNRIYSMLEDEKGHLWLGTASGLDLFDPSHKTFRHFNKKSGLSDELILGMLKDDKENLWISHSKGISKINTLNFKIRNYNQQDGLQDNEFSEDAYYKSKITGEMFFGGVNGLNSFYPDSIKENPFIPRVVLTNLEISNTSVKLNKPVNGRIILTKPFYLTKSITLTHEDKSIAIEFAALHFSNPNNNKYAYMLEGFDKTWVYVDATNRKASYSNLEAGTYVFKVKGSNNDGFWNEKTCTLTIIVLPPWWKTWWFRGLIALIILSNIIFYLIKTKKQKQRLEREVAERTKDLKETNLSLSKQKETIARLSEFGKKITATLNLSSINNMVFDYLSNFMDADILGIGVYNPQTKSLGFPTMIEHKKSLPLISFSLDDSTCCAVSCFNTQKDIFSNDFLHEYPNFTPKLSNNIANNAQSAIYLPLTVDKKKIGIITVQSEKSNAYSSQDYAVLQTLASYVAIALDNAAIYETLEKKNKQLKKQTDTLNETNTILKERQQYIEEQTEELKSHSESLKEANIRLKENHHLIQMQADKLSETNKELSLLNSTKDRFFSIIAHDLRNPFHTIQGFSELLFRTYKTLSPEKIEKYLNYIYTASQSGNKLLENLLLWSRSQTGTISFHPEELNLLTIITETLSILIGNAQKKNLEIQISVDENMLFSGDENMLKTVIRNLVSNAIKFTPENGIITISALKTNKYIEVTVADTGVGISPKNQKLLFRVDANITTKGTANETGTGLGLILCKDFIEKHKGTIRVESEEGKGSKFKFTIPIA